ncbi:ABC transporter substrate-binding protein [Leptothermofonsia sichuanensis E412]|uniref:ABC transporter substrate-binding protein n=1 Tax=Leptothermofonsia sichuanensis TaxID=2917832 RepID=UPI001CA5FC69|nr:ABC transporter substrate-binding protein [Leptothermofonsia sichuanensis]QZZ21406.1 ABC transporter substrate-binding protein [Leptothermofonsia sichuanensis E412]
MHTRTTALILSLLLVGCNTATMQQPSASNGSPTETQVAPAPVSRVVALTSLSADIIHRLDQSKLVGISGSRLLAKNPEFAKLTRVSEGQTPPNLEKIVALKPDLVVGATGFHDQILEKLNGMGIRTLATQVTGWRSLEDLTRTLAAEIQADPEPLLKSYQSFLAPTANQNASTLVLVSHQPILAPNKTSWAGDLLAQFQINNLIADLQGQSPMRGYVTLSPEKVLAADPEILILVDPGDGTVEKLKSAPFWNKLKAVSRDRVYVFDYYGLVNPGSIDAIEKACQQLKQVFATQPS